MPLVDYSLEIMVGTLREMQKTRASPLKVACFSCPDVIVTYKRLKEILGKEIAQSLLARLDSREIISWHNVPALVQTIPDTYDLFNRLGYHLDAFDIEEGRGGEIILDLSFGVHPKFWKEYDFLFDCIANQCFDPVKVLSNAVEMVKEGGYILHVNPVNMVNQGFYSFSPTLYYDFYTSNGFSIIKQAIVHGVYEKKEEIIPSTIARIRGLPDDCMNVVLVRKDKFTVLQKPIMGKFKIHPKCKAVFKEEEELT